MIQSVYANLAACIADRVDHAVRNLVSDLGNQFKGRPDSMFPLEFEYLVAQRSEEHTSELQSRENLVCRLLLEKKKKNTYIEVIMLKEKNYLNQSLDQ